MTEYKQALIVVMENGTFVYWTGYAEDRDHAEGLAREYAQEKAGCQVWDIAHCPIIES